MHMLIALLSNALLIVVGFLGAADLIISKKPDAKQIVDRLAPYRGGLGVAGAIWAVVGLLLMLPNLGTALKVSLVGTVIGLLGIVSLFGTGFLLGFGLIQSFNKNAAAKEKAEQLRGKLVAFQVPMGLVCIVLGVLGLVFML
jgi:uncharacterized membrane protein SpoIIM required for sporulation